jgi:hypothetical protein
MVILADEIPGGQDDVMLSMTLLVRISYFTIAVFVVRFRVFIILIERSVKTISF